MTFLSELRTTPIRSIETTKTRLIKRLEIQAEDLEDSGAEGDGVVEKTVFASTKTKTILLPQFLKSPKSSFVPATSSPSRTSCSGCRLDVPTARHIGAQHDQLVNCAIVAEMHNCSVVSSN